MKRLQSIVASLLLLMTFVYAGPSISTYAYDPLASACKDANGATIDSPNCTSLNTTSNPLVGANGLLTKVTKVIAIIAGVAGILVVVFGGFNYITAAGDPQKAKKARDMIIGALIGLVIIVLAQFIITFVLKKL